MPRFAGVLLVAVLALAGCGGSGGEPKPDSRLTLTTPKSGEGDARAGPGGASPEPRRTGPVTKAEEAVVRGWTEALRRGDVERAVSYWRAPAIAANGSQPFRLVTRRAIRQFNEGLTCGAKLESVERDKDYVLATFRLTNRRDRPGACSQGVGQRARVLFLLRGGRIAQWIRASDPPDEGRLPGDSSS
jgi:hypothetical protein